MDTELKIEVERLRAENAALKLKCEGLGTRADSPRRLVPVEHGGWRVTEEGHNRSCCDPRFVKRDEQGNPVAWTVTLNEYQRSNLLWLLCDVAGYDRASAVVSGLMTGDWAGEVPNALRLNERGEMEESKCPPNRTAEEARRWVKLNEVKA